MAVTRAFESKTGANGDFEAFGCDFGCGERERVIFRCDCGRFFGRGFFVFGGFSGREGGTTGTADCGFGGKILFFYIVM